MLETAEDKVLDLLSNFAMFLGANSKVGVINEPVAYFVGVLWVMLSDEFLVNVAHDDYFVSPRKEFFANALGTMIVRIVAQLFEGEAHLAWDFTMERSNLARAT